MVEGTRLESGRTRKGTASSNLALSASVWTLPFRSAQAQDFACGLPYTHARNTAQIRISTLFARQFLGDSDPWAIKQGDLLQVSVSYAAGASQQFAGLF